MTISWDDFFKGRDEKYSGELTKEIIDNALATIAKADALLKRFGEDRSCNSGWRPKAVNEATSNAASKSKHLTGQAIDLHDPTGSLDEWINDDILEEFDLYREHPDSTSTWTHLQTVPPKSGHRTYKP